MLHRRRHSGFTLAELLIVIAIIAILVAIAIPLLNHYVNKAEMETCAYNRAALMRQMKYELIFQSDADDADTRQLLLDLLSKTEIHCPTEGTYSLYTGRPVRVFTIYCTPHGGDVTNTIPNSVLDKFQDLYLEYVGEHGLGMGLNDYMRKKIYEENGNRFPTLTVKDEAYYIQPFHAEHTETFYIFANKNGDVDKKHWYADYIYDSTSRKWYAQPAGAKPEPIMLVGKDWDTVKAEMERNHWKEVKVFAEGDYDMKEPLI